MKTLPIALILIVTPCARAADFCRVKDMQTPEPRVVYQSEKMVYMEGMFNGMWAGATGGPTGGSPSRPGCGRIPPSTSSSRRGPTPPRWRPTTAGSGSRPRRPRQRPGSVHYVVELRHANPPLALWVHTVLDGTPIVTRWLELRNDAKAALALTELAPWSGRLWNCGGSFKVIRQTLGPGIFVWDDWLDIKPGTNAIDSKLGNGYDDPFLLAQHPEDGTWFIGHLAWTANWRMDLTCQPDPTKPGAGLWMNFGPWASAALRVVDPGEKIETPATHLGMVEGDLDRAVQAMHDHVRRSVVPPRDPKRAHLIQLDVASDNGYNLHSDFNEKSVTNIIDMASAIGAELYLMDCAWYDHYGDWVASPGRFPRGLGPLADYAHQKGLLFGVQTEIEGGRNDWSKSKIKREHPDWFGPGNVMPLERPEIAKYMEEELARVVRENKADLYRNEFIPEPLYMNEFTTSTRNGFVENSYWRHYAAWRGVWQGLARSCRASSGNSAPTARPARTWRPSPASTSPTPTRPISPISCPPSPARLSPCLPKFW